MATYFDGIMSKYQCGFRKGFISRHCLIVLVETWKKIRDKGSNLATHLTELSKAFDYLLNAYCFDMVLLKSM